MTTDIAQKHKSQVKDEFRILKNVFLKACSEGAIETVEYLHKYFPVFHAIEEFHPEKNGLMIGCYHDHVDIVKFFIENEIDINAKDNYDQTALMISVSDNDYMRIIDNDDTLIIVTYLLENGADVNTVNDIGQTPLIILCGSRVENEQLHLNLVQLLIQYGADIHATCNHGRNALHYICDGDNDYPSIVRFLIEQGIDPTTTTNYKDKSTPFSFAISEPYHEKISMELLHHEKVRKNL